MKTIVTVTTWRFSEIKLSLIQFGLLNHYTIPHSFFSQHIVTCLLAVGLKKVVFKFFKYIREK